MTEELLAVSSLGQLKDQLRASRIGLGLTQEQMAAAMGVSQAYVAKIERASEDEVSFAALSKYAQAMGEDLDVGLARSAEDDGVVVLRTAPLIHPKQAETTRLEDFPAVVRIPVGGAVPSLLSIQGPSGVGKTVLLDRVLDQLQDQAHVVLLKGHTAEVAGDRADRRLSNVTVVQAEGGSKAALTQARKQVGAKMLASNDGRPTVLALDDVWGEIVADRAGHADSLDLVAFALGFVPDVVICTDQLPLYPDQDAISTMLEVGHGHMLLLEPAGAGVRAGRYLKDVVPRGACLTKMVGKAGSLSLCDPPADNLPSVQVSEPGPLAGLLARLTARFAEESQREPVVLLDFSDEHPVLPASLTANVRLGDVVRAVVSVCPEASVPAHGFLGRLAERLRFQPLEHACLMGEYIAAAARDEAPQGAQGGFAPASWSELAALVELTPEIAHPGNFPHAPAHQWNRSELQAAVATLIEAVCSVIQGQASESERSLVQPEILHRLAAHRLTGLPQGSRVILLDSGAPRAELQSFLRTARSLGIRVTLVDSE